MSFPADTGIFRPEEFDLVHSVYSEISSEDWFSRAETRRELFALTVIDTYRKGIIDPNLLRSTCREIAKIEFGNGGLR